MFYPRTNLVIATLALSGLAAPLSPRQDQNQGQPISVGIHANRSAPASEVFGTTFDKPNFTTLPTGLATTEIANCSTSSGSVSKSEKDRRVDLKLTDCSGL
ncbi:hypothetical protein RhiXN_12159 [Rhizoctonia solani]|uniref:Uncharacterized protein n=1 Tax=Rhizoctonia solani TaxID=456999 RepID=A0A8H8P9X9_9AGAM|nr:uncharacterized protein RhiXN_12159 [Rhizoctonia solani]QRW26498.1 hypothetical protein RhiXN_12159 [Rhizoctonia solani]